MIVPSYLKFKTILGGSGHEEIFIVENRIK